MTEAEWLASADVRRMLAFILAHCRSGGEHARGCWVVDALLGKE